MKIDWDNHPLRTGHGTLLEDSMAVVTMRDGTVYTFGGAVDVPNSYKDSSDLQSDVYHWDAAGWQKVGDMPRERAGGSAVELESTEAGTHRVLVVGGWGNGYGSRGSQECVLFDISAGSAQRAGKLEVRRSRPHLRVIVHGCVVASSEDGPDETWEPRTGEWTSASA